MATLLARKLPDDIAGYIYHIALNKYLQEKIDIYSINLHLIFEKHNKYFIKNDQMIYNLDMLLTNDINIVILILRYIKNNFIDPYKKWDICFTEDYINTVMVWTSKLLQLNKKYINSYSDYNTIDYKYLLMQKTLIESINYLLDDDDYPFLTSKFTSIKL
jgi:hypothetical protein